MKNYKEFNGLNESYYENEFVRLGIAPDYFEKDEYAQVQIKVKAKDAETKWININKESIDAITLFLSKIKKYNKIK